MAILRHAVNIVSDGSLLILSGAGRYHTSGEIEETTALDRGIDGTFIEWRIRDGDMINWSCDDA
ncbi:MAG: hypothetical protein OXC91_15000 [Rhodobacteraceae bacterium]|nr:hypothetical protein [Paracoccaceae bacterium]